MKYSTRVGTLAVALTLFATVTAGAVIANLTLNGGQSSHVSCAGRLSIANRTSKELDLRCVSPYAQRSATGVTSSSSSTSSSTTTTTNKTPSVPSTPSGGSGAAAGASPSFVACGTGRSSAMSSPFGSLAAAKAAFPNTSVVDVPAGDNSGLIGQNWMIAANTTYFFEPGVHTVGAGQYSQIVPANNDTFVGAPGAILDGQDTNNYAFTQNATGVTVEYLEIRHFVSPLDEGVVNHDAGTGWTMLYNYMHDNGGAAMILGDHNTAEYNCLDHNAQYGFQIFGNTVNVQFNEISNNDSANVESSNPGCGCSGGMKAWEAQNVTLDNNWVHNNMNVGLWVDTNNVGFDISNNVITDNTAEGILYETSYNFHITGNYIARNAWVKGPSNGGFPNGAVYISESGGDARVGSTYANSEISGNTFVDNWGGVTLWENANRYCAGAGGDHVCTLVNPSAATMTSCGSTAIASAPLIDDCRWKTQNVSVHNNTFKLTAANVPNCTAGKDCGDMALISQAGGCPNACSPGDPYLGDFVMDNITYHQNNHFTNNTYQGPWRFEIHEQNSGLVSFAAWQASPYNQDSGSTLTP